LWHIQPTTQVTKSLVLIHKSQKLIFKYFYLEQVQVTFLRIK
jgi:hypothetical protein